VGERNSKVLLDVDLALKEGKQKLGVVYGGLHLQVRAMASILDNQYDKYDHKPNPCHPSLTGYGKEVGGVYGI